MSRTASPATDLPPSGVADSDPRKTAGHRRMDFSTRMWRAHRDTPYGRACRKVTELEEKLREARARLSVMSSFPQHAKSKRLREAWLKTAYGDWAEAIAIAQSVGFTTPTLEELTDL